MSLNVIKQLVTLSHLSSNATVQYHQAAAEQFRLNATDMKTIPLLQGKARVYAGDIARSLNLTTGAVTNVIDRLEGIGVVRRVHDPKDRRKILVELVPEGIAKAGKIYEPLARAMKQLLESYNPEQQAFLAQFLQESTKILQDETLRLRSKR